MFTGRVKVNANFKNTSQAVFYGYRPVKSYKLIPCFWKAMLVASGKAAVFFGKKTAAESLPEIPIECGCNTQDDYGVDHIPMIPACTCGRPFFWRRRSEYQTLYFFCFGCFRAKADNDCQDDTEEEHPSAEEQPVHVIEQGFEQIVGCVDRIAVKNFGSQAGNTDDDTCQHPPHTSLGRSSFPTNPQQEGGGDTR